MNRKFKSIGAAVLTAAMCVSLTGCAKEEGKSELNESNIESHLESIFGGSPGSSSSTTSKPELEPLNAFDGLTVVFDGISPKSNISIKGGSSYVTYTPNIKSGMKNGDVVTVTAELRSSYANKYVLTETKKEFIVEGLPSYVEKLDELSEDVLKKMDSTAQDNYAAYMARSIPNGKLKSMKLMGNYLLCPKDPSAFGVDANRVYCVYEMEVDVTQYNRETDAFYWCAYFRDITILPDGTISLDYGSYTQGNVNSMELALFMYLYGSNDLDTIFSKNITANLDKYSYESTVTDAV